jgi:hypothetical protein
MYIVQIGSGCSAYIGSFSAEQALLSMRTRNAGHPSHNARHRSYSAGHGWHIMHTTGHITHVTNQLAQMSSCAHTHE